MRRNLSIIVAVLLGIAFGYVSGLARNASPYIYCGFPIALAFVASRILIALSHRWNLDGQRQLMLLAVVCGVVMLISNQFFAYHAYVEKLYQDQLNFRPAAEAYDLIDRAFMKETGYSGYMGYVAWKLTHSITSIRVYSALPVTTTSQQTAALDTLIGNVLDASMFLIVPIVLLYLHGRHARHERLYETVGANTKVLAYFRNPRNEAATPTFQAKNWPLLSEMVYAGSAPSLPALEIHQSGNVDPITGNPYLHLIQRGTDNLTVTLKTESIGNSDLQRFLTQLQLATQS